MAAERSERLIELEAVRGVAACVVLIHHCLLAFAPTLSGLLGPTIPSSLFGTPLFALVNGSAAVVVFFVLSGFVLTHRAIEAKEPTLLGVGAAKRWPRLAAPILAVSVMSALLAMSHLYWNIPAGGATGSTWLVGQMSSIPQDSTLWSAVYEGSIGTFLFGEAYFNPSLWTMFYEFFGSMFVFGIAYSFLRTRLAHSVLIAAVLTAASIYFSPFYLCFAVGVGLAILRSKLPKGAGQYWKNSTLTCWMILAFLLFGYHEHMGGDAPLRFYEPLSPIASINPIGFRVVLHTIGATIVICTALARPSFLRRAWGPSEGCRSQSICCTYR